MRWIDEQILAYQERLLYTAELGYNVIEGTA